MHCQTGILIIIAMYIKSKAFFYRFRPFVCCFSLSGTFINFSVSDQQGFVKNQNLGIYDLFMRCDDVTCQLNYIKLISL